MKDYLLIKIKLATKLLQKKSLYVKKTWFPVIFKNKIMRLTLKLKRCYSKKLFGIPIHDMQSILNYKWPLPNISNNLIHTLVSWGYHQIEVNPAEYSKTSCETQNVYYEVETLKNEHSTLQRVMDNILGGMHNSVKLQ